MDINEMKLINKYQSWIDVDKNIGNLLRNSQSYLLISSVISRRLCSWCRSSVRFKWWRCIEIVGRLLWPSMSSSDTVNGNWNRWFDRFPALGTNGRQSWRSWRQKTATIRWNGQGSGFWWWWWNSGCTRKKFGGCGWRLNVWWKTWRRLWPSNRYNIFALLLILLLRLLISSWLLLLLIFSISTVLKTTKCWWTSSFEGRKSSV